MNNPLLTRRTFLRQTAATGLCLMTAAAGSAEALLVPRMGLTIASCGLRSRREPASRTRPPFRDALDFLRHCQELGGGGIQTGVSGWTSEFATRLRREAEASDLFLEGQIRLPADAADQDRFEREVRVAREAGIGIFRAVMLNTRRYETFGTMEEFRAFERRSWNSLTLAEPILGKHQARLALENHKDWRVPELLDILRRIESAHVGVCVDTGNSISLLEEPGAVVEAYAARAFTTHFKDMAVQEYDDGFLLSEVPLGEGFLDLPAMVHVLRRANPAIRFNLEMITRDPLKVPCLTRGYYATMPDLPAQTVAQALHRVRANPPAQPLPRTTGLDHDAKLALEEAHNQRSFAWTRTRLVGRPM